MHRLLVVVVLLLAACATDRPPTAAPEGAPLRVMSFNLRLNLASDSADAWPHRREAAAAIVRRADLVGVQEALPDMLADLDARAPAFARVGVGRDADGGGEASALLYRTDRLALVASGTFWLSETPDVPGSRGWDAALPRIATWGRFRDRRSGRTLVAVNTHFDHVGEEARRQSARLLVDRLPALADGDPAVLLGDFNVTDDTEAYRVLTQNSDLRDARRAVEAPEGDAATFTGFRPGPWERRIDYVFAGPGVRVHRFATVDDTIGEVLGTDDARLPSDHFPVVADVTFDAP